MPKNENRALCLNSQMAIVKAYNFRGEVLDFHW
jgi:hypothetical protein